MAVTYTGNLIIVAAPSGGGKTSLVRKLASSVDNIAISISHTTRNKRPGEVDGADYFFIDEQLFLKMVSENAFVEYAQVFSHYYGTSVAQIKARLEAGIDVLLDIDWQGAQQIRRLFPDAVSVFIVPPSLDVLKQRLQGRRQDHEDVIKERMKRAQDELSHYSEFDYIIVNDDFEKASAELLAIVVANRLKIERQSIQQRKLLSFLLSSQ
ncbi:guanylate kinase [Legionella hackeliae]|uniref:Guanylate kinase n=1 Tax=Legionella hackeliae TaxID=449 RepID=A0A0A8ULN0_LEGHA|nr:guanylate kinase [Legionella hackeliae]KTD10287.1 guanylate kinase [Legionella hackeliae]CEK09785.1 Guanylate kinase [Legionella hackeliae]STX49695.1 guanylate kinase [Legionella hackeliae]